MPRITAPAVLCAVLALSNPVDAKGAAAGVRAGTGRVSSGNVAAYRYGAVGAFVFMHRGRSYSPSTTWATTHGWTGNATHGYCGSNRTCGCPLPQEENTKAWVWVQMRVSQLLCSTDCLAGSYPDIVTFEVDLFKEVGSQTPCDPPTQVLVLRQCVVANEQLVTGGLADDQLFDPRVCIVVGDEQSVHSDARMRRLQQTGSSVRVIQFVVGAPSEAAADRLHNHVRNAVASRSFKLQYLIPDSPIVNMETQREEELKLTWILPLAIFGPLLVCGGCFMAAFFGFHQTRRRHNSVRPQPAQEMQADPQVPVAIPVGQPVPAAGVVVYAAEGTPAGVHTIPVQPKPSHSPGDGHDDDREDSSILQAQ